MDDGTEVSANIGMRKRHLGFVSGINENREKEYEKGMILIQMVKLKNLEFNHFMVKWLIAHRMVKD